MRVLQDVNRQYANLYGGTDGEPTQGSEATFHGKWGWIATINDMANNDRTKWDYFFKMNVIEFLNTTSFYKDKGEDDKRKIENYKNG